MTLMTLISALDEQNKPRGVAGAVYTKNTTCCFHQLLLAVLKSYDQALQKLDKAGEGVAEREGVNYAVYQMPSCFWYK
jgi:hypothetical protein